MAAIHGTPVAWYNASSGASFPVDPISIAAGTNLVYYAAVYINSGTIGVDTLARGAQSASRVGSPLVQGSQRVELWRIIAPATGSAGPTVALSGSVGAAECQVIQWVVNNADRREVLLQLAGEGVRLLDHLSLARRRYLGEVIAEMPAPARAALVQGLTEFSRACAAVAPGDQIREAAAGQ